MLLFAVLPPHLAFRISGPLEYSALPGLLDQLASRTPTIVDIRFPPPWSHRSYRTGTLVECLWLPRAVNRNSATTHQQILPPSHYPGTGKQLDLHLRRSCCLSPNGPRDRCTLDGSGYRQPTQASIPPNYRSELLRNLAAKLQHGFDTDRAAVPHAQLLQHTAAISSSQRPLAQPSDFALQLPSRFRLKIPVANVQHFSPLAIPSTAASRRDGPLFEPQPQIQDALHRLVVTALVAVRPAALQPRRAPSSQVALAVPSGFDRESCRVYFGRLFRHRQRSGDGAPVPRLHNWR